MFGRFFLPIDGTSESGDVGGIEHLNNLLTIIVKVPSHPINVLEIKEYVHLWHCVQTPSEDSTLLSNQSFHHPLLIEHFSLPVYMSLPLQAPLVWFISNWSGSSSQGAGATSN